jgi:hypothetical protein
MYNPSTGEMEVGELLVGSQSGLYNETLPQKQTITTKIQNKNNQKEATGRSSPPR